MKGLITLTHLLLPLLIGLIIGGAISGESSLLIWSVVLLIADIIAGISMQTVYDNRQRDSAQGKWTRKDAAAFERLFIEKIMQEASREKLGDKYNKDSSSRVESMYNRDSLVWRSLCRKFEDAYSSIELRRGSINISFNKINTENAGAILLDVCKHIPHPPLPRTLWGLYEIFTERVNGNHALVYKFLHSQNSICENVYIYLIHTQDDKIRLFAVETDFSAFVLCEYSGNSHLNYGRVELQNVSTKIKEILNAS